MENTAMAAAMAGCGVVLAALLYGLTGMLFRKPHGERPGVSRPSDGPQQVSAG